MSTLNKTGSQPFSLEYLKNLSAFGALSDETIHFLKTNGELLRLDSRQTLFHYGDTADEFYILLEGCISFYKENSTSCQFVRDYLPGDQIGVSAMITLSVRQGVGIAKEKTAVLKVSTGLFQQLHSRRIEDFILLTMNMFRDMARGLKAERNNIQE